MTTKTKKRTRVTREQFLELLSATQNINEECEPGSRRGEIMTQTALKTADMLFNLMSPHVKGMRGEIQRDGVITVVRLLAEVSCAKDEQKYAEMETERGFNGDRHAEENASISLPKEGSLDPLRVQSKFGKITAEVHRDDYGFKTTFDAEPWFRQASDKEILALAKCGWGGDYPADEVARFCASGQPDVADVLDQTTAAEGMGFECHVNEAMARQWLFDNRKKLWAKLND